MKANVPDKQMPLVFFFEFLTFETYHMDIFILVPFTWEFPEGPLWWHKQRSTAKRVFFVSIILYGLISVIINVIASLEFKNYLVKLVLKVQQLCWWAWSSACEIQGSSYCVFSTWWYRLVKCFSCLASLYKRPTKIIIEIKHIFQTEVIFAFWHFSLWAAEGGKRFQISAKSRHSHRCREKGTKYKKVHLWN